MTASKNIALLLLGLVRWLLLVPLQLLGVLAALALTRLAVAKAAIVHPMCEPGITDRTWQRMVDVPMPLKDARRLPRWARFIELMDDQFLPPGRYEPDVQQHAGDWQAQSRAMLYRNPASTLAHWLGGKINADFADRCWEVGKRHGDQDYGFWLGVYGTRWHVMSMFPIGSRDLQLNVGFVLRDYFDGHRYFPSYAKLRLPAVRLKARQAPIVTTPTGEQL